MNWVPSIRKDTNYHGSVYFLHDYYPVKRFAWGTLDQDSETFRSNLLAFKEGKVQWITRMFAYLIVSAIRFLSPNFNSSQYAFLAVPASSEYKTCMRYSLLLAILKQAFPNATFINDYITFNGERQSKHLSHNYVADLSGHFKINGGVCGKRVIIFDDVVTTGRSMNDMKCKLRQMGAAAFLCLSFGRTVDYRKFYQ